MGLSTSNLILSVQGRIEVNEPIVDFRITGVLFIVDRRFADFSSYFHCTCQVEADGPFADFYIWNSGLKSTSGLPEPAQLNSATALPSSYIFLAFYIEVGGRRRL